MKVIKAFPPNWIEIAKVFPVKGKQGILYAYGDRLYNPSGVTVTPWIMAHEEVHGRRQLGEEGDETMDVVRWWDNYLAYEDFRFNEELLAHQAEYKTYRIMNGARLTNSYLDLMAKRLSSPLYGSMVSYEEALRRIKEV